MVSLAVQIAQCLFELAGHRAFFAQLRAKARHFLIKLLLPALRLRGRLLAPAQLVEQLGLQLLQTGRKCF